MSRHIKFSSIGRDLSDDIYDGSTYMTRRKITSIAVHCSYSPQGRGDDAREIDRWHRKRWGSGIGYHYIILEDGTIEKGRWVDYQGAGIANHNPKTIHICWIGGTKNSEITPEQVESLQVLTRLLISDSMYRLLPCYIKGHNEYIGHYTRGCPMIDMSIIRDGI